jgi:hypothetical protein
MSTPAPEEKPAEEPKETNHAVAERQHKARREAAGDAVPPWPHDDVGPENSAYLPENLNKPESADRPPDKKA